MKIDNKITSCYIKVGRIEPLVRVLLAAGSMLGAWAATHEAAKRGAPFIRHLLIVVVIVSAIRYLFF